jgi:hypothetical protein
MEPRNLLTGSDGYFLKLLKYVVAAIKILKDGGQFQQLLVSLVISFTEAEKQDKKV